VATAGPVKPSIGSPLVFDEYARILLAAGLWEVSGDTTGVLSDPPALLQASASRHHLIVRAMREKMALTLTAYMQQMGWDPDPELIALGDFFAHWEATLYRSLDPVFDHLAQSGIRAMLLKGGDLRRSGRPAHPGIARMMSDLDLLVKAPDVAATRAALVANGFEQGIMDRASLSFRRERTDGCAPVDLSPLYAADHYELPAFGKFVPIPEVLEQALQIRDFLEMRDYQVTLVDGVPYIAIKCDVHVNLSRGLHLDDIWRGVRDLRLPSGTSMLGQSPAGLVWFLASRLYHEAFGLKGATVRQLVDVLTVVRTWKDEIDWDEVIRIACKYELRPSLFYVLTHVNELLGPLVPQAVIDACNPMASGVRRDHDWGDLMPRLLGGVAIVPVLPGRLENPDLGSSNRVADVEV
jgi:hypothetical protein